jgi:hypothetical protein
VIYFQYRTASTRTSPSEEIRVIEKSDALERNQTTITRTLGSLLDRINEFKYDVKKETSTLQVGFNESRNEAGKESSKLQEMMGQLIQHTNNNNNTSQTAVSSAEKKGIFKIARHDGPIDTTHQQ